MYLLWLDNNRLGGERTKRTILVFAFYILVAAYLNSSHFCLSFGFFVILPCLNFCILSLVSIAQTTYHIESAFGKQAFHDRTILGLWPLSYINASISFLKHASSCYMYRQHTNRWLNFPHCLFYTLNFYLHTHNAHAFYFFTRKFSVNFFIYDQYNKQGF